MYSPKVAILDYGIDTSVKELSRIHIEQHYVQSDRNLQDDRDWNYDMPHNNYHATNIALTLVDGIPDISILFIGLGKENSIKLNDLCDGIELCLNREDVSIICISLGFRSYNTDRRLFELCHECVSSGKIIVSAIYKDIDVMCLPAAFPFVYGVGAAITKNPYDYQFTNNTYINILARGDYQRLLNGKNTYRIGHGSSYAVAFFTVGLIKILRKTSSQDTRKENIDGLLSENSTCVRSLLSYNLTSNRTSLNKKPYDRVPLLRAVQNNCILFPGDLDLAALVLPTSALQEIKFKFILGYPSSTPNPELDDEIRYVPGIISPKTFKEADAIFVQRCSGKEHLINRMFWLNIIQYGLKYDTNFITIDNSVHAFIKEQIENRTPAYKGKAYNLVNEAAERVLELDYYTYWPEIEIMSINIISHSSDPAMPKKMVELLAKCGQKCGLIGTDIRTRFVTDCLIVPLTHQNDVNAFNRENWPTYFANCKKHLYYSGGIDICLTHTTLSNLEKGNLQSQFFASIEAISAIDADCHVVEINPTEDTSEIIKRIDLLKELLNISIIFLYIKDDYENVNLSDIGFLEIYFGIPIIDVNRNSQAFMDAIYTEMGLDLVT